MQSNYCFRKPGLNAAGICIFEGFLDASMNIINITNLAATTFRYSMELRIEKIYQTYRIL